MKQKELSIWLKAIDILLLICLLFFSIVIIPDLGHNVSDRYEYLAHLYTPCLIFYWVTAVPVFASLFLVWRIFTEIGRNNSFSFKNARRLQLISILAIADFILYVILMVIFALMDILYLPALICLMAVVAFGIIAAVVTAALSHLTYKAAELKTDSDLTI